MNTKSCPAAYLYICLMQQHYSFYLETNVFGGIIKKKMEVWFQDKHKEVIELW